MNFNEIFDGSDLSDYLEELLEIAVELGFNESHSKSIEKHSWHEDYEDAERNLNESIEDFINLRDFISNLSDYNTNLSGESIIPSLCFSEYSEQYADDQISCSFAKEYFDYEAFESNLQSGFQEVTYNGNDYYVRIN